MSVGAMTPEDDPILLLLALAGEKRKEKTKNGALP